MVDLLIINPGGRRRIYQGLADDLAAVEPPLWARLIAGYCRDRGHSVNILDADALDLDAGEVAAIVRDAAPQLVCVAAYGHQPSASTQSMEEVFAIFRALPTTVYSIVVGGHAAALPIETFDAEYGLDFVCNSEGPVTVDCLLQWIKDGSGKSDLDAIPGLVWADFATNVHSNPAPPLLDVRELHGNAWDLLPMEKYRAHNWQGFGADRQPYASIYTSLGCPYKCLAGDTLINTIYGDIPIKELAEKYGDSGVPVYTYDPETREAFIADTTNIRKYGEGEKLVRVHFDDGTHIDCTPDHKFMQFKWGNGKSPGKQWACEAQNLPAGAHVRAIKFHKHEVGYVYASWARRSRRRRSRMVMDYLRGRKLTRLEYVHHLDHDKSNDHPDNLEYCASAAEHIALHPEISKRMSENNPTKNGMSPEWIEKVRAANTDRVRSLESRERYRQSKLGTKNPNYKHGRRTGAKSRLAETNHRVARVESLEALGDVYCLTVPKTGWFFANNVLVKNCSFCCINAPFGTNRYRMRAPSDVVSEISHLHNHYGVNTFKITDEMFVLNERHYTAICEGLAALPYKLNIWAYARIDTIKPERLALMRQAGIRWLALGIESGSAHVRDGSDKTIDACAINQIVQCISDAKINVIGNFIFGLPDDTMETMEETLDLAMNLECEFSNFYVAMAYPGSALHKQADPHVLPQTYAGYSQHSIDTTPLSTKALTAKQIVEFRDRAFDQYFTDPQYLNMIEHKFGTNARHEIVMMTARKLERVA